MKDRNFFLIKKCKKGDIDAFEELTSIHQKTVYNIALKILKKPEDATEISQEALIQGYKSINTFDYKDAFEIWVYKIVINKCLDFMTKNNLTG